MKRVAILLGMGLGLIGSTLWAQDDLDMPRPSHVQPITVAPAPIAVAPAPACCPSAACAGHGHSADFCDWLMYHPPQTHCACQCVISNCYPPVHLWFVDMCQGNCGGRCGHGAPAAPCCNGECHAAPCANKCCTMAPCIKDDSDRPSSLMDWLRDFWE